MPDVSPRNAYLPPPVAAAAKDADPQCSARLAGGCGAHFGDNDGHLLVRTPAASGSESGRLMVGVPVADECQGHNFIHGRELNCHAARTAQGPWRGGRFGGGAAGPEASRTRLDNPGSSATLGASDWQGGLRQSPRGTGLWG